MKRITDQTGQTFILHIEFQVANEPKMVHRMHNYCAMLLEQYEIPVRQYVFYLGSTKARMLTSLRSGDLSFRYNLISFQDLDYQLFLSSETPEEILLAILANFQPNDSPIVLKQMLDRLDETANGPLVFEKYIAQLRVLVQLRNLQPLVEAAMDNLTKYVNEQNDPFYVKGRNLGFLLGAEKGVQEGLEKGLQEGLQKGIQEGLQKGLQEGLQKGIQEGLQKGIQEGLQKGLQEGLQEGLQKGIQEGLRKGESKAQSLLIKNLLTNTDFTDDKIATLTGVSLEFVKETRLQLGKK